MRRSLLTGKRSSGPPDWPPAPPDGYRYRESPSPLSLYARIIIALWVPLSILAVLAVISAVHGPAGALTLIAAVIPQSLPAFVLYVGWVISLIVLQVVIHELLHMLAAVFLGYDVSVRIHITTLLDWRVSVITYGKFQTRLETTLITLAPLLVFTPFGIAALLAGGVSVTIAAAFLLLINTTGAVVDVQTALLMLSLPHGELLYCDSDGRQQYYTLVDG